MTDRDLITWPARVQRLRADLGREPTIPELLTIAAQHEMTSDEIDEQGQSWARANIATGDPRFD